MLETQTIEKRRHARLPTRQSAELFLGVAQPNHVCMVLDRSASGIQIDLGETLDLPETMIIQFSSEASQLVRRCWAAGTRAGMEFIGPPSPAGAGQTQPMSKPARPTTGSLPELATEIAASLRQIEVLIRRYLNVSQEEPAVFFSETGSRPGAGHRHKVTIIAPQAESAALRIEAAINDLNPRPAPRRFGAPRDAPVLISL